MNKPTEAQSVQARILKYASQVGWKVVPRNEADVRRGDGLYFADLAISKLRGFNSWLPAQYTLPIYSADISGNRDFLAFLRGQKTAYDERENRERNITVINFADPSQNVYEVTDEFSYSNSHYTNREDVVFLINGFPVAVIECKNITKKDALAIAIDQLRRYHRETPEMMVPEQIFAAAEGIGIKYGVTWNVVRRFIFDWKGEELGDLEGKIQSFFAIPNVLDAIQKYLMFTEKDGEISKLILRQHQRAAVEAVIERGLDHEKFRGLIWHTQGSGKTYTMIKTAELLFTAPEAEKPTILLMLDRNELEDQMVKNLVSVGMGNVRQAETVGDLESILKDDYRGIVISMIHKFRGAPESLNTRSNIYVLIDEAHRSTSNNLGNYLMAALPNATLIGYTGTPIDKTAYGRGTFKTFGIDDEKGYLHKYSIAESIEDGTTLPLFYSLAPNEMLVPKETLEEEFLNLKAEHGVSDIDELNAVLERAVNTKNFLKGRGRIEKVAEYVAKHFQTYVEPLGYKAFLVGVDREACALYKHALDKYLPPEYSEVVYTGNNNDSELLKEFHHGLKHERTIRREFAKFGTMPKILIVTEKLLTGYDAPILYAMYLDKPVRDHTLLQTIARVNRPYENEREKMIKPHGFVLDFVGIFDKLEKALSFDSDEVEAVVKDLDLLKDRFKEFIERQAEQYLRLVPGAFDDRAAGVIIAYFQDEEKRKAFFGWFNQLEMLFEIISPDAFLRPYIDRYDKLANIYEIARSAFTKRIYIDKEFQHKTAELVQRHITSGAIQTVNEVFEINARSLAMLKAKNTSDEVKVVNLIKSIEREAEKRSNDPVLISLKDRAEKIREAFESKQIDTKEALKHLLALWEQELERHEKQQSEGLTDLGWFLRETLEALAILDAGMAASFEQTIQAHPDFAHSEKIARELRNALYIELIKHDVEIDRAKEVVDVVIRTLRKAAL